MPVAEKALIGKIRRRAGKSAKEHGIVAGIGDDCAVLRLPPGHEAVVTTDFSLEGVHFRRGWHSPEAIGRHCLTRGLSDIAAMGGEPIAAFLSLALPGKLPQRWVDRFLDGLLELAEEFKVALAGGDTAESSEKVLADIVVLGSVPKGKAILRSGARPGDHIYVSGELGRAAASVDRLRRAGRSSDLVGDRRPTPRIALGRALRQKGLASAMIDISDGLSTDLAHLCEESGVGAEIAAQAIPCATIGRPGREVDLYFALHGGDDYELLFTAPGGKNVPAQLAGVHLTQIGRITRSKHVLLMTDGKGRKLVPQGWEHFTG